MMDANCIEDSYDLYYCQGLLAFLCLVKKSCIN